MDDRRMRVLSVETSLEPRYAAEAFFLSYPDEERAFVSFQVGDDKVALKYTRKEMFGGDED
jgi:hypothetical protein